MKIQQENVREYPKVHEIHEYFLYTVPLGSDENYSKPVVNY